MLQNNLILRFITPTHPETGVVTRPKSLEDLDNLRHLQWLWSGKYKNGKPYYNNKPAIRILYDHFKCRVRKEWRLRYPHDHDWRNVNPYHVKVANGYNFDRTSPDVQDLLDAIPQYDQLNSTPQEIYNVFHQMYSISDIEKALKILLPETS